MLVREGEKEANRTCMGVCMGAMGWSMEVKAEMADMRTSSLTSTLPWTRVCVKGEGGTVM